MTSLSHRQLPTGQSFRPSITAPSKTRRPNRSRPTRGQDPLPPINDAEDVRKLLDSLQNGWRRGPNQVGMDPDIKEVWDVGSMKRMWDWLTRNAKDAQAPTAYDGRVRMLPDGTKIGFRDSSKGWGDTINVWYPDGSKPKIHIPYERYFPSFISAPPQLPPVAADPAPLPVPGPETVHAPVALPPSAVFDPNGLPPWLQNASPPGFSVQATQAPTIMPGVELPAVSAPTASPSLYGLSILPDLGHDLSDVGKAAGAGVVGGVVVIGTLLADVVTPSGQIAR